MFIRRLSDWGGWVVRLREAAEREVDVMIDNRDGIECAYNL